VAWHEPTWPHDGRVALYLPDQYLRLAPPVTPAEGELAAEVRRLLASRGALFFSDLAAETGAFTRDLLAALWALVWAGEVTNDTLAPWRALIVEPEMRRHRRFRGRAFRSRRSGPREAKGAGRCCHQYQQPAPRRPVLRSNPGYPERLPTLEKARFPTETERRMALTMQLLQRYGVLTREAVHAEEIPGGFAAVYDILKTLEEQGASGAATSWPAWAQPSSPSRAPTSACALCARRRNRPAP